MVNDVSCRKIYQEAAAITAQSLFSEVIAELLANEHSVGIANKIQSVRDNAFDRIGKTGVISLPLQKENEVSEQSQNLNHDTQDHHISGYVAMLT